MYDTQRAADMLRRSLSVWKTLKTEWKWSELISHEAFCYFFSDQELNSAFLIVCNCYCDLICCIFNAKLVAIFKLLF